MVDDNKDTKPKHVHAHAHTHTATNTHTHKCTHSVHVVCFLCCYYNSIGSFEPVPCITSSFFPTNPNPTHLFLFLLLMYLASLIQCKSLIKKKEDTVLTTRFMSYSFILFLYILMDCGHTEAHVIKNVFYQSFRKQNIFLGVIDGC